MLFVWCSDGGHFDLRTFAFRREYEGATCEDAFWFRLIHVHVYQENI